MFSDEPLPFESLRKIDATVRMQAGQVLLPRLRLSSLGVEADLRNGHLLLQPLKATLGGGILEMHADLETQGEVAQLRAVIKVSRLNVGRLSQELGSPEAVEGVLDVDAELTGRGKSIAGLMGGLNGKTVTVMEQGKIDNKYLDLLGGDLGSVLLRLINPARQETQYTPIHCCVSGFIIRNGLAETTALVLDTDEMTMVGDGEIDLKTERLNLGFKPALKQGIGTSATGKIGLSLGELAKAFRLSGTLTHPSLQLDTTETAATAAKMLGGIALFGPAGVAGALVSSSSGDKNPCLTAIEAARKGVKLGKEEKAQKKKSPTDEITKSLQDVGKDFLKLFGK